MNEYTNDLAQTFKKQALGMANAYRPSPIELLDIGSRVYVSRLQQVGRVIERTKDGLYYHVEFDFWIKPKRWFSRYDISELDEVEL